MLLAGVALPASAYGQCVINAPAVDACLGGVRINGPSLPPGVTLDLNFMQPGTLDPRITFTRASSATYTDASGVIQTAATNAPRWDYDPVTHALRGVLIEEARTNLALQSSVGVAPWAPFAVVVTGPLPTANNTIAPDGTTTGTRLSFPAVAGVGAVSAWYQAIIVAAVVYTFSVWLRGAVGGEQLYLNASTSVGATFISGSRITLTTQWQRFSWTTPALTAESWAFVIGTDLRDATQTNTPAQTIYAWGADVEPLPYMSSYIPTTSVSVTRAADSLIYPPASMTWFTPPGGSWFAEFIPITPTPGGASERIISDTAVHGFGPVFLVSSPVNALGQYDTGVVNTANVITLNAIQKGVTTWAVGNAKACLNAGAVASSAGLAVGYAALTSSGIRIGPNSFPADGMSGWTRRISYWPRTLSDSEMQQVTT